MITNAAPKAMMNSPPLMNPTPSPGVGRRGAGRPDGAGWRPVPCPDRSQAGISPAPRTAMIMANSEAETRRAP